MDIKNDDYKVIEKLGSGGGGNVYLAYHKRLGKYVVLKADKRKITTKKELLRREVDILKNLSHTYIPQVYDFFVRDGIVYTVIDYIEGESLDKPLKRGEFFSQAQVIRWGIQILEALSYLHKPEHGTPPRGFVHGDIKPANIMRKPDGDICLIDFNIALAIGESNVIGCSPGYASPEHYGLDFSGKNRGDGTDTKQEKAESTIMETDSGNAALFDYGTEDRTAMETTIERELSVNRSESDESASLSRIEKVVPDVRSDIYSVGATLYHLLSGKRPARDARKVEVLSEDIYSPVLVKIIAKAMNPNPDLRFQTAEEMLDALIHIRSFDPRVIAFKKKRKSTLLCCAGLFLIGILIGFTGLKRMKDMETWLNTAQHSEKALEEGNRDQAVTLALEAIPSGTGPFYQPCMPQVQKALTDALGCYDLSDTYYSFDTIELSSEPFSIALSPDGNTLACLYTYEMAIYNTNSMEKIATLPAEQSALSEVEFINDNDLIFAGEAGITAIDTATGQVKWTGERATAIAVSGDRTTAAAIYKEETKAIIYDVQNGEIKKEIDFSGKSQDIVPNDIYVNPENNILELNENGTKLAVSFSDGSLMIYDTSDSAKNMEIFDKSSSYMHFEGGFYEQYFAFSASDEEESLFAVIDTNTGQQTGGFVTEESVYSVDVTKKGIYVQTDNILVKMHPVTGEQTPLVTTAEQILQYVSDGKQTMISTDGYIRFFDENAEQIASYIIQNSVDYMQMSSGTAAVGSMNSPMVRIFRYQDYQEQNIFSYDRNYEHDEARMNEKDNTLILFSYDAFRIYDANGKILADKKIPDAINVYDQQFKRDGEKAFLEVTYNDGTVNIYDTVDGSMVEKSRTDAVDKELTETFYTSDYRIESSLHGSPEVYDAKSGEFLFYLKSEDYLTYITEIGNYIIAQYMTADDYYYGELLNKKCETLAELPYLCDVSAQKLFFDCRSGNIRTSKIYSIDELLQMAKQWEGEKQK
ncbi:MAG: protein kinase [Clostridiales bacterium]|nr:protein kinase [Clostridiales bacterium]